jgi:hypothetical protein
MKTTSFVTTILAAGMFCLTVPAADNKTEKKAPSGAAMEMPKPVPEMKELAYFVGTWNTVEKFEVSTFMPNGGTSSGTNTVRLGPGGFSALMEQHSKSSMGPFWGHGVMAWDPEVKAYKFAWTDSMAPGIMLETGHIEGNNLVWKGEVSMMGKKYAVKDVISDRTPTSYTMTSYMNDGSGEKKTMTIKATKQGATAAK